MRVPLADIVRQPWQCSRPRAAYIISYVCTLICFYIHIHICSYTYICIHTNTWSSCMASGTAASSARLALNPKPNPKSSRAVALQRT